MKTTFTFKNIISFCLVCSVICYSLTSCKVPAAIPDTKMKVIVWILMKNSYDSTTSSFKFTGKFTDEDLAPLEEVFMINKVSREDFYYTFETYQQDPAKLKILIDSVIAYGSRMNNKPTNIAKPNKAKLINPLLKTVSQ